MATLIHWFPQRKFILLGDGGYASHELARFCHRHGRHVTLVSRFHPQANLYEAPGIRRSKKGGRPRTKGRRVAKPVEAIKNSKGRRFTVNWYGGKTRRVELIWGEGHWYKAADGLVPVRWVFVHDLEGTHRDEYFYSTDPTMPPEQIVSLYTGRWSIEVTFQEVRTHLGFANAAKLVEEKRVANGGVPAGIVQRGQPDLPPAHLRTRRATRVVRVVRQDGDDLRRRHDVRASIVLVGGFSTVAETCGCHKTTKAVTDHAAGSFESCRVTP